MLFDDRARPQVVQVLNSGRCSSQVGRSRAASHQEESSWASLSVVGMARLQRKFADKVAVFQQEIISVIKGRLGQKNPHKVYLAIVLLRQVKAQVQPRHVTSQYVGYTRLTFNRAVAAFG